MIPDFTDAGELGVTLAGESFGHRLYHFVLAHSQWEYARVVEELLGSCRGTSKRAVADWGLPREHRTDSLSAAFKNLSEQEDFTRSCALTTA
jgi:hypothetical protein